MVQGRDITKAIIGKRIRVTGGTTVEGLVEGVSFSDHGVSFRLAPAVEPFGVRVSVKDETEVEVLDSED